MNLISNTLDMQSASGGHEVWKAGTSHDNWVVKASVELLSGGNDGLPKGQHTSALKLCVGGEPGIIEAEVQLTQGKNYRVSWVDVRDLHGVRGNETDKYSFAFLHDHNLEGAAKSFETTDVWLQREVIFTPRLTGTYYVSFAGMKRNDKLQRGALITDVNMDLIVPVEHKVTLLDGNSVQQGAIILPENGTNKADIVFRLSGENNTGINGQTMTLTLTGSGITFVNGEKSVTRRTGDDAQFNPTQGYFRLEAGTLQASGQASMPQLIVQDSNEGRWSFTVNVQKKAPIYSIKSTAKSDLKLDLQDDGHGRRVTVQLLADNDSVANKGLTVNMLPGTMEYVVAGIDGLTDSNGYVDAIFLPRVATSRPVGVRIGFEDAIPLDFHVSVADVQYSLMGNPKSIELSMASVDTPKEIVLSLTNNKTGGAVPDAQLIVQILGEGAEYLSATVASKTDKDGHATLSLTPRKATSQPHTVTVAYGNAQWSCEVTQVKAVPEITKHLVLVPAVNTLYFKPKKRREVTLALLDAKGSVITTPGQTVFAEVSSGKEVGFSIDPLSAKTDGTGRVDFRMTAQQEGSGTLTFTTEGGAPRRVSFRVSAGVSALHWEIEKDDIVLVPAQRQRLSDQTAIGVGPATAPNHPATLHWEISPSRTGDEGVYIENAQGSLVLKGDADFNQNHQAEPGVLVAGDHPETRTMTLTAEGLPATSLTIRTLEPDVSVNSQGEENNPIHLPEGEHIAATALSQDNVVLTVAGPNNSKVPLSNVDISFRIESKDSADIATFERGKEATVRTNLHGVANLPALNLHNGSSGSFHISIFVPWKMTRVGVFYYSAVPAEPIKAVKFAEDAHRNPVKLYGNLADQSVTGLQVNAYCDSSAKIKASYGTVTFTIDDERHTGCHFSGGQVVATADIGLNGIANCPAITTGPFIARQNTFQLRASVAIVDSTPDSVTVAIVE